MNAAERAQLDRETEAIAKWAVGMIVKAFGLGFFFAAALVSATKGAWAFLAVDLFFIVGTLWIARSDWQRLKAAAS